jgi:hypothetical protein
VLSDSHRPRLAILLLIGCVLASSLAAQTPAISLKNWATPLFWQPSQAERERAALGSPQKAAPQVLFFPNAVSTTALTFVAITPCRLVDTRGAAAGFNGIEPFSGPSIIAGGTLAIPMQSAEEVITNTTPAPCGAIADTAQAYSLNLTVIPHAGGAVDYVTLWPSAEAQPFVSTLNDSQGSIVANAAIVPAGIPSGGVSVYNSGPATTDVVIDMNGYYVPPTDVKDNTAIGEQTLASNTIGAANMAIGAWALAQNTSGSANTASGASALTSNTTGTDNTASGAGALTNNTTGSYDTAVGDDALASNTTGNYNTASGHLR